MSLSLQALRFLSLLLPGVALSAPGGLSVEWAVPLGCPEPALLHAALEQRVPAAHRKELSAKVTLARQADDEWRAEVETRLPDGEGRRVVTAATCERAADAAVLVVALAAMRRAAPSSDAAPGSDAATSSDASPATEPSAPASPPPTVAASREPRAAGALAFPLPRLRLQPTVGLNVGVLPAPAPFVGLSFLVSSGQLRAELGGSIWLPSVSTQGPRDGTGAVVELWTGLARGCRVFEQGRLTWGPCLGLEAGQLKATGLGIHQPQTGERLWGAALLGGTAGFRVGREVHLWLNFEGGANLSRPSFRITSPEGQVEAHRPAAFLARVSLGLDLSGP